MVRDGDASLRDDDFRHRARKANAPQDFDDGDNIDTREDVLPCYTYIPNGPELMNLNPMLVQTIKQHDYFKGLEEHTGSRTTLWCHMMQWYHISAVEVGASTHSSVHALTAAQRCL